MRWIHQYFQIRPIVREHMAAIREAKRIDHSKFENKVTDIVRFDGTSLDLTKTILKFDTALEKEYKEKLLSTRTADILKGLSGSDFLM